MFTSDRIILRDLSLPIRARHSGPCGPYYMNARPLRTGARCAGFGGYLSSDESEVSEGSGVRLRVVGWADHIVPMRHKGWFTDDHGDGETARGLVLRLPNGRGFLAGWSMGAGMCASFAGDIYDCERDAAYAADEEARCAAEQEREYQAAEERAERERGEDAEYNERD